MYLTKDDYRQARGVDLDIEFGNESSDKSASQAQIFINKIENWLIAYLKYYYTFQEVNERNMNAFKEAVICQIDYVRMNGDTDISEQSMQISPSALRICKINGMANIKID